MSIEKYDDDMSLEEEEESDFITSHQQPTDYGDYDTTTPVSMETHIPESNIGYKLLQKMGWKVGKGLGSHGQGRVDPIRIELKDDSLGIGKAEEYMSNHISSTAKRKTMEMEKQLEESAEQKEQRESKVEKSQAIAKELEQVKRAFYCELCDKQYKKISEYEQHLQSYDHHHKKRFKDMKETARSSTSNRQEREKKLAREKKREERELKRMQEALLKRAGGNTPAPPTVPSPQTTNTTTATSNKGGWTTASSNSGGGGGWSTVSAGSNGSGGGGWATVEAASNDNKSGGWSTVSTKPSDTTAATTIIANSGSSNSGSWPAANSSANGNKEKSTNTAPSTEAEPIESSAKPPATKMSFGIKKSGGFQFGLKKK